MLPRGKAKKNIRSRSEKWSKVILGEPASKANQRRLATIGGVSRIIKSAKALAYVDYFHYQCPVLDPMFESDVCVAMTIFYASRRPDLDESVILDAMQGYIYRNDRQVKMKVVIHALDKENPRAEITVFPLPHQ